MFLLLTKALFCCQLMIPWAGSFVVFFVNTISDESSQIALEVIITKKMAMPIFVTMTKGISSCNNIKFDRVFACCQACEMPKFLLALVRIVVVPLYSLIRTARPLKFLLLHFGKWLLECATACCEIHDNRICCRALRIGTWESILFSCSLQSNGFTCVFGRSST